MKLGTHTFLKPSTYGAAGFGIGFFLYLCNPNELFPAAPETIVLCTIVTLAFILSGLVFDGRYRVVRDSIVRSRSGQVEKWSSDVSWILIIALAGIGLLGTLKYIVDAVQHFGSIAGLAITLVQQSAKIRTAAPELASFGTQLTYFGWIAAMLIAYKFGSERVRVAPSILFVVLLASNLLYIDRTRPTWIIFVAGLCFLYGRLERLDLKRLMLGGLAAVFGFLALFVAVGYWVGKVSITTGAYDPGVLSGPLHGIALYVTGGFGYLNEIVQTETSFDYIPERSLYPAFEFFSRLGLAEEPPPRILEFFYIPHRMNVGTFIEPLYRDGGLIFTLVGLAVLVFGADFLALKLLAADRGLAIVGWGNICFANALSFFTPKFSSFPFWLILGIAVLSILAGGRRREYEPHIAKCA